MKQSEEISVILLLIVQLQKTQTYFIIADNTPKSQVLLKHKSQPDTLVLLLVP